MPKLTLFFASYASATIHDMLELFDKEVALGHQNGPGLRDLSVDGINNGDHPMQADTAMHYIRNY